jgi:uncharacterized paraquat-inducible protein A
MAKKSREQIQLEEDIKWHEKLYGGVQNRFYKKPDKKVRNCLRCRKPFKLKTENNYTCSVCQKINQKQGPNSIYQI